MKILFSRTQNIEIQSCASQSQRYWIQSQKKPYETVIRLHVTILFCFEYFKIFIQTSSIRQKLKASYKIRSRQEVSQGCSLALAFPWGRVTAQSMQWVVSPPFPGTRCSSSAALVPRAGPPRCPSPASEWGRQRPRHCPLLPPQSTKPPSGRTRERNCKKGPWCRFTIGPRWLKSYAWSRTRPGRSWDWPGWSLLWKFPIPGNMRSHSLYLLEIQASKLIWILWIHPIPPPPLCLPPWAPSPGVRRQRTWTPLPFLWTQHSMAAGWSCSHCPA